MTEKPLLEAFERLLRRNKYEISAIVNKTIYFTDTVGRQWALGLQFMREASNPTRCDYCGLLDWTQDRYERILHKHDCPHRTDDACQTHPTGCPDV
jgi:hypothetical protein